jgi:hypothetical protein
MAGVQTTNVFDLLEDGDASVEELSKKLAKQAAVKPAAPAAAAPAGKSEDEVHAEARPRPGPPPNRTKGRWRWFVPRAGKRGGNRDAAFPLAAMPATTPAQRAPRTHA